MARPSIAAGIGVFAQTVFEPEARSLRPASWGARRCRREAEGDVAPSGACFFWVLFFARAKKSTSPAVREPQLLLLSRARSARTIQSLDSRFRGNDSR